VLVAEQEPHTLAQVSSPAIVGGIVLFEVKTLGASMQRMSRRAPAATRRRKMSGPIDLDLRDPRDERPLYSLRLNL
jgi:hypothetical protein